MEEARFRTEVDIEGLWQPVNLAQEQKRPFTASLLRVFMQPGEPSGVRGKSAATWLMGQSAWSRVLHIPSIFRGSLD